MVGVVYKSNLECLEGACEGGQVRGEIRSRVRTRRNAARRERSEGATLPRNHARRPRTLRLSKETAREESRRQVSNPAVFELGVRLGHAQGRPEHIHRTQTRTDPHRARHLLQTIRNHLRRARSVNYSNTLLLRQTLNKYIVKAISSHVFFLATKFFV